MAEPSLLAKRDCFSRLWKARLTVSRPAPESDGLLCVLLADQVEVPRVWWHEEELARLS